MDNGIDPYQVLGVPRNFTLEELKAAFKKTAIRVHPDKGGNEYMFNMVTECFKHLMHEWKRKHSDKQFHTLKTSFKQHQDDEAQTNLTADSLGFNLEKFNRLFDEHKRPTVMDRGYDAFLRDNGPAEPPKFKGGTKEDFNQHFEKHVTASARGVNTITKYKEPEAMAPSTKIQYYEMGVDKIDDFSGENVTQKRLNYSDLKMAHSTSRIIDPNQVKYKTYKNIDELKKKREAINYEMSKKDRERMIKQQELLEKMEQERLRTISKEDLEAEIHYQKMRNLLKSMQAHDIN
jgi:curved DNA-binding protein CbpA